MRRMKRKRGSHLNTPQNSLRRRMLEAAGIDKDLYRIFEEYEWYDVINDDEKIIGFVLERDREYIYGFSFSGPGRDRCI